MKYIKSIKTTLLIILICFCTFCSGYTMGSSFVFADSTTDNWQQVTTNEQLVEAFKYYCKSRDLTIEGSLADGVTSFTTKTFNGICNTLGIDVTALQAHLKYETDSNLGMRFLFDSTGISAYNRIFAQFLQDNDINVGDTVNDTVYDGYLYNGNLIYVIHHISTNMDKSNVYTYGVPIKTWNQCISLGTFTIPWLTGSCTLYCTRSNNDYWPYQIRINNNSEHLIGHTATNSGQICYVFNTSENKLHICSYYKFNDQPNIVNFVNLISTEFNINNNPNAPSCNIVITTNNNTVNNNTYEGDTIINNNGTPSEPEVPTPEPEPDYQPAEDWDIDLPDLSIPNWILSGKENKFPFDIPFNVMYALSLLQAEPEAPRLEGTLDFGFYEWDYDLDLSDFDTVAEICRNMEVLAFITGLMLMTRKLIWG